MEILPQVRLRNYVLVVTGFLPGWLSSLIMSGVLLSMWVLPDFYGWDQLGGLRALVFIEAVAVVGALYIFQGIGQPLAWLPVVPIAGLMGVALWSAVSPVVALVLPVHMVVRIAGVWSDIRGVNEATHALILSFSFMAVAWFAVGFLPLPALGWTTSAAPVDLWWEVPTVLGMKRLSFALPAWGLIYFFLTACSDLAQLPHILASRSR